MVSEKAQGIVDALQARQRCPVCRQTSCAPRCPECGAWLRFDPYIGLVMAETGTRGDINLTRARPTTLGQVGSHGRGAVRNGTGGS